MSARWHTRLGTLAGFWLGAAAAFLPADEPDLPQRVAALVQQLDIDQRPQQLAALRELESLGPPILAHLPPPDVLATAAGRDALGRLRIALERDAARRSIASSTITLAGTASTDALLRAFVDQTGNELLAADGAGPFPVDWRQTPFWDAVDEICRRNRWQPQWDAAAQRFRLGPAAEGRRETAAARSGPFRVAIRQLSLRPLAGTDQEQLLRVGVVVQAEPRLRPLFLRLKTSDWSARVGRRPAPLWNPQAEYELPVGDGGREVAATVDLRWPSAPAAERWFLEGRMTAHVAAATARLEFDAQSLRKGVLRRRGGVSVRLRSAAFTPEAQRGLLGAIRLTVSYDAGGPAFESHRAWVFHQSAYLQDAQGQRIPFGDNEVTAEADGGMTIEYRFHELQPPVAQYRFVYEAPTLLIDVPLSVRFDDLSPPAN